MVLKALLDGLGRRSWTYREGRSRKFWVLETSAVVIAERPTFSTSEERLAYARGYFDAEVGRHASCPRGSTSSLSKRTMET
jgi:hypothetical protein